MLPSECDVMSCQILLGKWELSSMLDIKYTWYVCQFWSWDFFSDSIPRCKFEATEYPNCPQGDKNNSSIIFQILRYLEEETYEHLWRNYFNTVFWGHASNQTWVYRSLITTIHNYHSTERVRNSLQRLYPALNNTVFRKQIIMKFLIIWWKLVNLV